MRRRTLGAATGVALSTLLLGCGGGPGAGAAGDGSGTTEPTATSTLPPAKGGPLPDLPECAAPPDATGDQDAVGLVMPEGAVVTGIEDVGELVSVQAYAPLTPIAVRRFYAGAPAIELYVQEDETYEAEILYGAEERRVFVRAQAQCREGSVLSFFIGPEDGAGLPSPSGG